MPDINKSHFDLPHVNLKPTWLPLSPPPSRKPIGYCNDYYLDPMKVNGLPGAMVFSLFKRQFLINDLPSYNALNN